MRSLIGDGAMGRVYEGWDPLLSRVVAVKAVKSEHLDPRTAAEYLRRFAREAHAAGTLNHPSVVKVFDVGGDYMVMELVEGPTLKDVLAERKRFAPEEVVRILAPIADALDHAHRTGVVHRDVKPANIILQPDGTPKLMDFGVAYVVSSVATAQGEVVGSPCYMSPEQIIGEDKGGSADVYALGIVAYEMLTGQPPFTGTVTQVIYRAVHETAAPASERNPSLPPGYDAVFARALHKEPKHRYASATELVAALSAPGAHEGVAVAKQASGGDAGAYTLAETVAMPSRAGWYAHVETVAWGGLAAAGRRASAHRVAVAVASLLCIACATYALLPRASLEVTPASAEPALLESESSRRAPADPSAPAPLVLQASTSADRTLVARPAASAPVTPSAAASTASSPTAAVAPPAPARVAKRVRPAPRVTVTAIPMSSPPAGPTLRGQLVELGPDVTPPRQVSGVTVLPRTDSRRPLNGTVGVSMLIDEHGVPGELAIVESAGPALDRAALASVRTWRFTPAQKDGVPVRVRWVAHQSYRLAP